MENNSKFITGAIAGVALGVGAALFLNSKKGKELRDDAQEMLGDFYKHISPKLKKIEKMGRKEYEAFMEKAIDEYKKLKNLSADKVEGLKGEVGKSFDYLVDHLKEDDKK